jgi:hypothetical protein
MLYMVSEKDGQVGFLKKKHRDYLRGESNIEPKSQDERDARRYIREHIRQAILDFSALYGKDGHKTQVRDRWKAIGGDKPIESERLPRLNSFFVDAQEDATGLWKQPDEEIEQGLVDAVAFIYSVANDSGLSADLVVERGLNRYAEAEYPNWIEPHVLLKTDTRESLARRGKQKIMDGEHPDKLEDKEIRALLQMKGGPLTPERVQEYLLGYWSWPPEELEEPE